MEQRQIKVTAQRIYPLCLLSWVILRQIKFFIVSAFLTLRVVYYISMRRFHRQNVSNTIWWVKFAPEWSSNLSLSSSQFKFFLIFAFFPVFWFDFYVNLRWCTRDTRATFFRGCLPGLMLHWLTTVFKELNIPRYLQVFLKDFDLSLSHTPEAKLPNLRTNYLNWLRV